MNASPIPEAAMTTTELGSRALSHQSWEYELPVPGGIVAGVDGSRESIAALNTAAAMARSRRCALHAVTVIPPFPSYHINPGADESRDSVDALRVSLKSSELCEIMKRLEPPGEWTHDAIIGRPARVLTSVAGERGADMIVVGRRQHSVMDRVLGGETTLQVMRMSGVPVLAVETDLDHPRTAVIAIDFSAPSIRAAKITLEMLGNPAKVYLVHVEPPAELLPSGFALPGEGRFPGDLVVWFRRLISALSPQHGVLVEPIVLNGNPVSAITEFAERVGANLIAAGSHGQSRVERFLLGSVSTGLVRNAGCPVLVAPPVD
jgi:nucleotide-binding universal stress UspA family protein